MPEFKRSLAVVIGIDRYIDNNIPKLETAVNDANKLADILEKNYQYQVLRLLDEDATKDKLSALLAAFEEQTLAFLDGSKINLESDERLLFYFAGHGIADGLDNADGPVGFIVPQDARQDRDSWLSMQRLHDALVKLPCRHLLIILDCCFAGTFRWAGQDREMVRSQKVYRERYDRFISGCAQQVITSAAYDEKAADSIYPFGQRGDCEGHSPFASLLFQALNGEPDFTKDGAIVATELYIYIRKNITAKQTPEICQLKRHNKGEYIFLLPGFDRSQLEQAPALDEKTNPYKGLASFEEDDKDKFFGRKALTDELQKCVTKNQLTVVLGASGSGKSSLVKAGLIPQLKKNPQEWRILTPVRLEESPFRALNNTLVKENLPVVNVQAPEPGVNTLLARLAQWSQNNPNSKLLLFIDQFEELITLCRNQTEREEFLRGLAEAIAACPKQFRLVLTLRNDFEAQLSDTALKPYWTSARFMVKPMTREELREVIVEPAAAKVMYFEPPTLVDKLIDEVMQMPGALPLLSFTLSELYFKYIDSVKQGTRSDRAITKTDYEELGGVTRSLTQRADLEYEKLKKRDRAYELTVKNVMLRMVTVDGSELARRKVLLSELKYPPDKNQRAQKVIQQFTDARLLVQGQDSEGNLYVEPAHDALVRGWHKLLVWKQQEHEDLILQRRLTPAAMEWNSHQLPTFHWSANPRDWWKQFWDRQQKAKFLWDGDPRLSFLQQILDSTDNWFNKLETEFVRRSLQRQRNNRRWTIGLVTAGFALVLMFAGYQWYRSQVDRIKTLTATSKELFASDQKLDALIEALKAEIKLKWVIGVDSKTRFEALTALQQAVYWVRERNQWQGHNQKVGSVAWSPDGKMLASGSYDGTIELWNQDGSEVLKKPLKHSSAVYSVAWSPDGKMLASGSDDGTIELWNQDGSEVLKKPLKHSSAVYSVAWSPDGKMLASGSDDGTITLWNQDGKELKKLEHRSAVYSVAWSPDGKMLASGSDDGTIELWNQDGKELKTLTGHNKAVASISFSPDSKLLISGSDDKSVILWSMVDGKELWTRKQHSDSVRGVAWSPDGKMMASASIDKTVILWSLKGTRIRTIKNSSWVESIAWSPDGKMLAWGNLYGTIKFWMLEGEELKILTGHSDVVRSVSFSPNSKMLASGSDDKSVKLWNLGGKELRTIEEYTGKVYSIAWSPDGKMLATGSEDTEYTTVKLWNPVNGKELRKYSERNSVRSVSFSPDGKLLASASDDGIIKLWSKDSNKPRPLEGHNSPIWSVSFSPDSKMLASSGNRNQIELWNLTNGKVQPLGNHRERVRSVAWSPNGKFLVSGSTDDDDNTTIKLWNLENREESSFHNEGGGWVYSVAWRPDGKLLASGSDSGTVKVWNLEGEEVMRLTGHSSAVRSVAWSHDGKWLASASNDKTVLLWNLELLNQDIALKRGCEWVRGYLKNTEEDRHLCDRVALP
ncbi:PD40 domain-containing protein [Phormidium sp. LEGE 05292]|uniref:nSTAND1 domain-containing NTPase n=1 Tax=[Phormidium] sp. LEGE 05292 TaxID=767427 RepID=UPI00187E9F36|nr:caspase family protein [Phormidium sp. LEGE 05292]MBE9225071.1 PD40 domain-containing protein [Phormidium sp. LEGE 05292]